MAESSESHRLVDTITDPELDWVGPEPRGIASVITPTRRVHHCRGRLRVCAKLG
ncbi:hypothetical protein A2U01_0119389, partial [Trifolium medium]|nr:hypothetical protein [Trifolium medium]